MARITLQAVRHLRDERGERRGRGGRRPGGRRGGVRERPGPRGEEDRREGARTRVATRDDGVDTADADDRGDARTVARETRAGGDDARAESTTGATAADMITGGGGARGAGRCAARERAPARDGDEATSLSARDPDWRRVGRSLVLVAPSGPAVAIRRRHSPRRASTMPAVATPRSSAPAPPPRAALPRRRLCPARLARVRRPRRRGRGRASSWAPRSSSGRSTGHLRAPCSSTLDLRSEHALRPAPARGRPPWFLHGVPAVRRGAGRSSPSARSSPPRGRPGGGRSWSEARGRRLEGRPDAPGHADHARGDQQRHLGSTPGL